MPVCSVDHDQVRPWNEVQTCVGQSSRQGIRSSILDIFTKDEMVDKVDGRSCEREIGLV